jgi:hypothetical protein
MEKATAAHRPLEMETASCMQSATTRVWGSSLGARRFSQRAQLTQRQSETCTTLDWPDTGRAWWAVDGAWSACGRVERAAPPHTQPLNLIGPQQHYPPSECGTGAALLQREATTHAQTHTRSPLDGVKKEREKKTIYFCKRTPFALEELVEPQL